MAVMQNSIIFGGVDSADYGIYIGGEGTFNAPKRDVEMISIPGRNGAFALDKGRFENIEVTYPAFNFEPNDYDTFAQNLSDFRNAICSLRGYHRLTDTFHPDEYRMAAYIGGLDIKPIDYNTASTFDIVFDCMPQRWLLSGEDAITAVDGEEITNPTLFESRPLLEFSGYGTIGIEGSSITVERANIGKVPVTETQAGEAPLSVSFDSSLLNTGDTVTLSGINVNFYYEATEGYSPLYSGGSWRQTSPILAPTFTNCSGSVSSKGDVYALKLDDITLTYGTTSATQAAADVDIGYTHSGSQTVTTAFTTIFVEYDGDTTITIRLVNSEDCYDFSFTKIQVPTIYGDSSKSTNPSYIDLDLGEAYGSLNGELVSLNNNVIMPAKLPTLAPGDNLISFDNTFTSLKITPRWWKV